MRLVDSTGAAFGTLGNPLSANITGAGSGGTSAVDESGFTAGVSAFTPSGGVFNDSVAALTSGQMGTQRLTANRAGHVNLRDSSGNELTPATISSANSSTTPLAGAAAFTGTGEDVSRYGSVQVSVLADQSSGTNGLSLQWSSDNSHWDVTEVFSVVASQAMSVRAGIKGRFFRVVYTNGATIQTAFRLQTIYQTAAADGTSTATLGSFTGPLPGARFAIALPYTFDSSTSAWGPVAGAKNLTGGVAGGALPAAAGMVFNTGDSKYYPALSGAAGSGTTGIGVPSSAPLLWDSVGGVNFVKQAGDGSGRAIVVGSGAAGAAPAGNPVSVAGFDGTNKQHLKTDTSGNLQVVGAAAAGTAVAGNPVRLGISDGVNVQDARSAPASAGTSIASTNIAFTALAGLDNAAIYFAIGTPRQNVDGVAATNVLSVHAHDYNGTGSNVDKHRNNVDVTLLASGARTTTQTSADITTYNLSGITVILDMTAVGTGSVTVSINGKDPASGKYYNLLTGAAVTTNSTNVYRIQPGLPAVANKDVNAYLSRVIQIVVTANNANSAQYSVGYTLHNP